MTLSENDKPQKAPIEARFGKKSVSARSAVPSAVPSTVPFAITALRMESLTIWVIERVVRFPRHRKFSIYMPIEVSVTVGADAKLDNDTIARVTGLTLQQVLDLQTAH